MMPRVCSLFICCCFLSVFDLVLQPAFFGLYTVLVIYAMCMMYIVIYIAGVDG